MKWQHLYEPHAAFNFCQSSQIAMWLSRNKLLCTINEAIAGKRTRKKPTRNEKLADANKQFDTYSKYYAYHTLSRIANNRIHMTKEKTQSIHSWPCERSSAPLPSFPVWPAPMILSCKLSRHLYPSAYAPVHWAVFVLLTLEALLISRLYAARISMQNKKNEENKEKNRNFSHSADRRKQKQQDPGFSSSTSSMCLLLSWHWRSEAVGKFRSVNTAAELSKV